MATIAWGHFRGKKANHCQKAVRHTLESVGVNICEHDRKDCSKPGIIVFDNIDQELYAFLREMKLCGFEHICAVTISPLSIVDGEAWQLLEAGASDVLEWNDLEGKQAANQIAQQIERWEAIERVLKSSLVEKNLVGHSPVWKSVLRQAIEIAQFTSASTLIMGESGTGKELVARLMHTLDSRQNKSELVVLDCTSVLPELSGSEFYGHERGAFTGATSPREGAFALANKGTLFLDEIGDLPFNLQSQLLRVVQEHIYKRVGGNKLNSSEFRLVCATNRDLPTCVRSGHFRSDLYYRISHSIFHLPPLRDRPEDILDLTRHFIAQENQNRNPPELDESVQQFLISREYSGNVTELKQLVTWICHRHVGDGPITVGDIPGSERPLTSPKNTDWRDEKFHHAIRRAISLGAGLKEIGQYSMDAAIQIAVHEAGGSLQEAAQILGVTDRSLQMRRANKRHNGSISAPKSLV